MSAEGAALEVGSLWPTYGSAWEIHGGHPEMAPWVHDGALQKRGQQLLRGLRPEGEAQPAATKWLFAPLSEDPRGLELRCLKEHLRRGPEVLLVDMP